MNAGRTPLQIRPARQIVSISLAGGRGSRMGETTIPKVCFPVAGVPAINRTLRALRRCGILTNIVVVGAGAGEVVRTVGTEFPDVLFVYQDVPRGTGHAGRLGFAPLQKMGFDGDVLIHVGDKVIDESVVAEVLRAFYEAPCDLAIAVTARKNAPDMGRVVKSREGRVLGVVEAVEVQFARLVRKLQARARAATHLDTAEVRALCLGELGSETRCARRLPQLWKRIQSGTKIAAATVLKALPRGAEWVDVGGVRMSPDAVLAAAPHAHESVYLCRAKALAAALEKLRPRPDVGEEYLTDIVHILASDSEHGYSVREVIIANPDLILGFNTPDQLLHLEEVVRARMGRVTEVRERRPPLEPRVFRRASEWLRLFETLPPSFRTSLRRIYLNDDAAVAERVKDYVCALRFFVRRFGADRRVVVVRAPGSLNLMGRHVDVRGGFINVIPVDREVIIIASPRADDRVRLANVSRTAHAPVEFAISRELAGLDWDDWLRYITSAKVRQIITEARGRWGNYVRAGVLRLQQHFRDRPLVGMDGVVSVNIPPAAGMGASSAIVVAVSEAVVALNGLALTPQQFVHLCGEGEWYVARRGTAASHAASKLGDGRVVSQVRFFPFEVETKVPFPQEWRLVLCRAPIGAETPDLDFRNRQSAALDLALMLIMDRFPRLGQLLEHLRDLCPERLGMPPSRLYEILLAVPQRVTPQQVARLLSPSRREKVTEVMSNHQPPAHYDLRDVLLFGIAECCRSERLARVLGERDEATIGAMMAVSHDAERVTCMERGERQPFHWTADDAYVRGLIADLGSEEPERVRRAQLYFQPGRYGSSRDAIDAMVDAAREMPGVIGVQLSGSGQGGSAMAIVHAEAVPNLLKEMRRAGAQAFVCAPVRGSGLIAP